MKTLGLGILVWSLLSGLAIGAADDLLLNEFSPPVSLADSPKKLAEQYREFLGLMKKQGEEALYQRTQTGTWPLYLKRNSLIGKKTLKGGLEFLLIQLDEISRHQSRGEKISWGTPGVREFLEVHRALDLNFKDPIRRKMSLSYGAKRYIDAYTSRPLVRGDHEATEWAQASTSFWTRPRTIGQKDFRVGFDREKTLAQRVAESSEVCRYAEPKAGNGTTPGATFKCGDLTVKAKFRETKSEPFAARVFWALGFNVDPVDFSREFTFKYDRRFFREINARDALQFQVTFFDKPVSSYSLTQIVDPFTLLKGAVLKSGEKISPDELKRRVIGNAQADLKHLKEEDFQSAAEAEIDAVITQEVQLQEKFEKSDDLVKVGPWDWEDLDHRVRQDVRGMVAASLWLGWYDCRFDNNRLLLVRDPQTRAMRLKHMLSDLGGVLGPAYDFTDTENQDIENFPWFVTTRGWVTGLHVVNLTLLDRNPAFEAATEKDVRWGLEGLNQITAAQIKAAAMSSGFASVETKLLLEKLESRRYYLNKHSRVR